MKIPAKTPCYRIQARGVSNLYTSLVDGWEHLGLPPQFRPAEEDVPSDPEDEIVVYFEKPVVNARNFGAVNRQWGWPTYVRNDRGAFVRYTFERIF